MKRVRTVIKAVVGLMCAMAITWGMLTVCARFLYPTKFEQYVHQYAREYDVPRDLVYSVIKNESNFRPNAVSSIGARGLMQITDDTFEWAKGRMGDKDSVYDDLFEAEKNIQYGTYILSLLIDEFGDAETALAAYHAGWGSVKRWLSDERYSSDGVKIHRIPFVDTAQYVPKVIATREIYNNLYGAKL